MTILSFLFLPLIFFLGLITSYEDIKYGKVRNKWIVLGLAWGLIIIILFGIWYFIASPITRYYYFEIQGLPNDSPAPVFTISLSYLIKTLVNAAIAFIVAFLMWRFDAWAAGDAKLFTVYALLIPLGYYWKSYLPVFPSFILLVNIFIPIFIYLLIRSVVYFLKFMYLKISNPKERKKKIKIGKEEIKQVTKGMKIMLPIFILIFLVFGLFQKPIQNKIGIDISSAMIFVFAGLIIFSGFLANLFRRPITFKIIIGLLVLILAYGFISSPLNTWQILVRTMKIMLIFMVVLHLFKSLINFHILKTGTKEVLVEELEPRMNLDEMIINRIKEDKEFYAQHIGRFYPGGLTLKQVDHVKKWLRKDKTIGKKINVYRLFPFVPWMFVGVLVTLILQSSLLHLLFEVILSVDRTSSILLSTMV